MDDGRRWLFSDRRAQVEQAAGWLMVCWSATHNFHSSTAHIEFHHFVQDWKIPYYIFTKWECSDIRVENVSVGENHYGWKGQKDWEPPLNHNAKVSCCYHSSWVQWFLMVFLALINDWVN